MRPQDYALAAAIWLGYFAAVFLAARLLYRVTSKFAGWRRRAIISFVLGVAFAPSAIGLGHGATIGPAWIALFQMFPVRLGVAPIVIASSLFFLVGSIAVRAKLQKGM